ncbi:hypothetical protein SAMN05216404_106159 [Nitrosospira multiformis]|uniref:Uncharacterized protein n=1 Tax=Nitrosospira multiformis TaxID=1231 RepID=A0A1H8ITW7_9PROT|nr:hypothetical protein [Nitrosospira multiformis]SEN71148.1 hypothetical protein SAMN05216404_106159 [Nitrosospira multiformis]
MKEWVYQVFIALDQLANTLLNGSADETISSRCFRLNHIKAYRVAEIFVNCLFFPFQGWDHCRNAYIKEVLGRQLPYEFYDLAVAMNIQHDKDRLGDRVQI